MRRAFQVLALGIMLAAKSAIAHDISNEQEFIYFFDPARPPVIERYVWDEKKHWGLISVDFDSDGDWALDTAMHFWRIGEKLTKKEMESLQKRAEKNHGAVDHGALFTPFFEERKNIKKLYRQADLYKALEADKAFRLSNLGGLRQLSEPLPWCSGNWELRKSVAYQNLLKRLTEIKLNAAPEVPADKTK